MSLTVGLAIAGGLVLAGVIAHGTWNSRRKLPQHKSQEPKATDKAEGKEPGLNGPLNSDLAHAGPEFSPESDGLPALPVPERKPGLDPLIDAIAHIALEEGHDLISGDAALAAMPTTRRVGTKPFAIEGLNARHRHWEPPVAGQRYSAFQAGVQLANRNGALNDIEFSEFVQKTTAFADALEADCDFPEMRDEVARARELDQFASEHDAQLGFTLRARAVSWSPGYLQQHAAMQGFVPGVMPGRMVLSAGEVGLPPILVLQFDTAAALADDPELSALRKCQLSLDVPQVARAEQAYARMCVVARTLAQQMDGIITDPQGARIEPAAMEAIGADLERLYDALDERDLSAGSPQARRLFS